MGSSTEALTNKFAQIFSMITGIAICVFSIIILPLFFGIILMGQAYSFSNDISLYSTVLLLLIIILSFIFFLGVNVAKLRKWTAFALIILEIPLISIFLVNLIPGIKNLSKFKPIGLFVFAIFSIFMIILLIEIFIIFKYGKSTSELKIIAENCKYKYVGPSTIAFVAGKKLILNTGDIVFAPESDTQIKVWLEYNHCIKIINA